MDPAPEELEAMVHIIPWCGIQGTYEEEASPLGSLLRAIGATPNTPVRVVGAIEEPDYLAVLDAWKINGEPPTPAQRSQAALMGRASWIKTGLTRTVAQEEQMAKEAHELAVSSHQAVIAASARSAQPTPPPTTALGKKVKMSTVAD